MLPVRASVCVDTGSLGSGTQGEAPGTGYTQFSQTGRSVFRYRLKEGGMSALRGTLTLVSELKPLPVLGVVAVEMDERFVRGAEQGRGGVRTAELPDHGARVVGSVLYFQVVVISFGRKIQKLNMRTWEKTRKINGSDYQNV